MIFATVFLTLAVSLGVHGQQLDSLDAPVAPRVEDDLVVFDDWAMPRAAQATTSLGPSSLSPKGASLANLIPWTDGILPVEFSSAVSEEQKRLFFEACAVWESQTPIRCHEGAYRGKVLKITKGRGCWSLWGMGNHFLVLRRRMNLQEGCWAQSTILHEIGHALGLIHEHQRPDRDQFVEINKENVSGGFLWLNGKVNFNLQDAELHTPYDFESIMHYESTAFSKNGKDTIIAKAPFERFQISMGRGQLPTESDFLTVRRIYSRAYLSRMILNRRTSESRPGLESVTRTSLMPIFSPSIRSEAL